MEHGLAVYLPTSYIEFVCILSRCRHPIMNRAMLHELLLPWAKPTVTR